MPPHCKVEILFCHRNNPQMANMASQTDNVWTWSDLVVAKYGDGGVITQKCHLCDQGEQSQERTSGLVVRADTMVWSRT